MLDTPSSFLESFFSSDTPDQHLLHEIYLHEVIYYGDKTFNISPYVGYVQLQAFTSFVNNQVKWKETFYTINTNEAKKILCIRGELHPVQQVIQSYTKFILS